MKVGAAASYVVEKHQILIHFGGTKKVLLIIHGWLNHLQADFLPTTLILLIIFFTY